MLTYRKFGKNESGLILLLGGLIFLFVVVIMGYFIIDMIVHNILAIAIAICLIICLPKAIDAYLHRKQVPKAGGK